MGNGITAPNEHQYINQCTIAQVIEIATRKGLSTQEIKQYATDVIFRLVERTNSDCGNELNALPQGVKEAESRLLPSDGKPPSFVTDFIDNKFELNGMTKDERNLYQKTTAWAVDAISIAPESPKLKRWVRLLLGCEIFVTNMNWAQTYVSFRSGLCARLQKIGEPLQQLFEKEVG